MKNRPGDEGQLMRALVVFDDTRCVELSADVTPQELPHRWLAFDGLVPSVPVATQLGCAPNSSIDLSGGVSLLLADGESKYYSLFNIDPLRVGVSTHNHIVTPFDDGCFTVSVDRLTLLSGDRVYLNGRRLGLGEHPVTIGDCVWLGSTRLVFHNRYVELSGPGTQSRLNLATAVPALGCVKFCGQYLVF
jgi:hypothetical protein